MAVINLITALEEHYGFSIADDEISAEVFETLGSLAAYVGHKLD
jgi:acyl carrier protein